VRIRKPDTIRRHMQQMDLRELRSVVEIGDRGIWTGDALEIAAEVLLERADEPPARSSTRAAARGNTRGNARGDCPQCGGVTEGGSVRLGSSFFSFLIVGFSWSRLHWRSEHGEEVLMTQGQWSDARRCQTCGAVVIAGSAAGNDGR